MALTVGTDTYLTEADANTYWSNRNNSTWSSADSADKEKALREATQYIDGAFEFVGDIYSSTQSLAWPRSAIEVTRGNFRGLAIDSNTYPQQLKDACAELALEALSARLRPAEDRGGAIKRVKVDVIETEYMDFAPSRKTYDFVRMILKPLLISGSSNQYKLVRA